MEEQLKNKWIEALESERYIQTIGQLKVDESTKRFDFNDAPNGYCCLGVLCEVAGLEISEDGKGIMVDGRNDGYGPLLDIISNVSLSTLYRLNDGAKYTFPQIAKWIKENV